MVNYRRNYVCGGYYFFTVVLHDRRSRILVENIELLRESLRKVQKEHPYKIEAIVILPEHLHCIWQMPENDSDYPRRWKKIKNCFTQQLKKAGRIVPKNSRGESLIWQKRYWEHTIRDDRDFENHMNYIHYNPVKHGYVKNPIDWPYSSFHQYVKKGYLPSDWGASELVEMNKQGKWGE